MLGAMSWYRRIAAAAAAAIAFASLTNAHAHVHLCFDGQEPPASMHWTTGEALAPAAHDHVHPYVAGEPETAPETHDDVDLEVTGSALTKTVKHDAYGAAPAQLLLALVVLAAEQPFGAFDTLTPAGFLHARPQPRAPPLPLA